MSDSRASCHVVPPAQYESDELDKNIYQEYDSDSDVADELKQDYVDEQTGDIPLKRSVRPTGQKRNVTY